MGEKKLIIVESPTKAKTIRNFLGDDCTVVASNGHVRTLPKNDLCIDVKNGYKPKYIIDESKEKIISQIKSELKNAKELILATDEDREGESISWHLVEVLKPSIHPRRMVFHEITKKAILEAFKNGREIDMDLVHAQEARRILDRLYGYTISPVLWKKLSNKSLSAGRVQSPGLRLIVDREKTRLAFKKAEYWDIKASFGASSGEGFYATIERLNGQKIADGKDFDSESGKYCGSSNTILLTKDEAQVLVESLNKNSFNVIEIKEKQVSQKPYPPFITSTLQQEGNRKLHLSAKETMRIAQSLYENGFITYMRTDSPTLSQEGLNAAREAVRSLYGDSFLPEQPKQYTAKSSNAQEAHEAIRPSGEHFRTPDETALSGKELDLYTLIWKRTLASQMNNALKQNTNVQIEATCNDGRKAIFAATGVRIEYPGFLRVYVEGSDDPNAALEDKESPLPKLENGQKLNVQKLEEVKHETKEPNRYTEASLVQALEKLGIGRPSTYASIIDRLFEKAYIVRENGNLVPTFIGFGVVQLLEGYFSDRIDYGFTRDMEDGLDLIAEGKLNELEFLKNFYEGDNGLEKQVKDSILSISSKDVKKISLPQLSEENSIHLGPFGPYVKSKDGKFVSVPKELTPATVTNDLIQKLRENGSLNSANKPTSPQLLGNTKDGTPILYCTGRYGDYWQLGDKSQKNEVKRFKVPKNYIGNLSVSPSTVMKYFELPISIGATESGALITGDIGKYGPYIKCEGDFRSVKDAESLFSITEQEARDLLNAPKETKKSSSKTSSRTAQPFVDFGTYDGKPLGLYQGRYGFYLKYGDSNVRIAKEYQKDEKACKEMTKETAISFLQ